MNKTLLTGLAVVSLGLGGNAAWAHDYKGGMIVDADGNGSLSRAEAVAGASKRFARMDANDDGALTSADREARMAQHRTEMFAKLDSDRNGQISCDEFMAQRPEGMRSKGPGHHRMGVRGERSGMMMRMADTNSDGRITRAEFTAAALARFDRADADRNGQVTAPERKAMRENWRAMRREGKAG